MSDFDALPVKPPARQSIAVRKEQLKAWDSSVTAQTDPSMTNKKWAVTLPLDLMFLSACESGDVQYAKELLSSGVDINVKNSDGLAALHQATVNTDEEMLTFLLDNGADVDIFDNEGWTPLHAAASVGSLHFVKLLVERGANPVAVNHDGDTPYDLVKSAANDGEGDAVADFLLEVIKDQELDLEAWKAAEENMMRVDSLNWLKEKNFSAVNQRHPETGASPLHVAASKNFTEIMRILLRAGANVNAQDFDLWTALHATAHWSLPEAARILTEWGASFKIENKNGHTPKDLAEGDMLSVMNELEQQQQELIEARKCNSDEIEDTPRLFNTTRRSIRPSEGAINRSSVCRTSVNDKENLLKLKDKELEKFEILRKQGDSSQSIVAILPSIPQTPPTPPDERNADASLSTQSLYSKELKPVSSKESEKTVAAAVVKSKEEDVSTTSSATQSASVLSAQKATTLLSTTASYDTANTKGNKNNLDVDNDNDDTESMVSSISSFTKDLPSTDKREQSKTNKDAIGELIKELESNEVEQLGKINSSSKQKSSSQESIGESASKQKQEKEKERRRVDRIEEATLKSTRLQLQMPFNHALQSNEPVPLPKPNITISRKPIPSQEQSLSEAESSVKSKLAASDEDTNNNNTKNTSEETCKTSKTDAVSDEASGESNELEGPSPMRRTASWRVKKKVKTDTEDKSAEVGTLPPDENNEDMMSRKSDSVEEDQSTPNAILLPKNEEKEITRKQRARFERNTRRSTQGISAADLESALASPHHHPIREDKKEERERRENKFIGGSPAALLSPTISNASTAKSSSTTGNGENQEKERSSPDATQCNGAGSASGTGSNNFEGEFTPTGARKSSERGLQPSSVDKLFANRSFSYGNRAYNRRDGAGVDANGIPIESTSPRQDTTPVSISTSHSFNLGASGRASRPIASSVAAANRVSNNSDRFTSAVLSQDSVDSKTSLPQSQSSASTTSCPTCHQRTSQLESEIKRLNSELGLFKSASKWDDVQQEKQERLQLLERVGQLERKLTDFETMSKNYAKVRNENASLIKLLANFVRSEYNISPQQGSNRRATVAISTGSTLSAPSNNNVNTMPTQVGENTTTNSNPPSRVQFANSVQVQPYPPPAPSPANNI